MDRDLEARTAGIKAKLKSGELNKLDVRLDALRGCKASRAALSESRGLDRWDTFLARVAQWFGPVSPNDGASQEEIDRVEERLGLELPLVLWEFHSLVGGRLGRFALDPVFSVSDLHVGEGILYVSGDSQGCYGCGVRVDDLEQDDPPVQLVWAHDGMVELASASLADFLTLLVFRDAVLGGEDHVYHQDGPLGSLPRGTRAISAEVWGHGGLPGENAPKLESAYPRLRTELAGIAWRLLGDTETLVLLEGSSRTEFSPTKALSAAGIARTRTAWDRLCDVASVQIEFDEDEEDDEDWDD